MDTLQQSFETLTATAADPQMTARCWQELQDRYTGSGRYYHTLQHLEHMLGLIEEHKKLFSNIRPVLYALFYHDAIYDAQAGDNEEQSALLAAARMKELSEPVTIITTTLQLIRATAGHKASGDRDTDLFTDIDLAILGAAPARYQQYTRQIRQEYAIYPDLLYYPGRKKVLQHFLDMPQLYKTADFRERFEQQARQNMREELLELE